MFINLITSVVVGVVTALLTTYLTFRRFRAERLWEKKVEAYVRLISAAHEMKRVRDAEIRDAKLYAQTEDETVSKDSDKIWKESYEAKRTILQLADVASFLISDEIESATTMFVKDLDRVFEGESWTTWAELMVQEQDILSTYLWKLKAVARKELRT